MKNKRYTTIQESREWGTLSVSPEDVFRIDKDKEFSDFSHLSEYLDTIIQSKLDLITLLHFSDLKTIKTDLFFTLSGIDIDRLLATKDSSQDGKDAVQTVKDQLFREQVRDEFGIEDGGGPLLRTHAQRKKAFPINFDTFLFDHYGVYDTSLTARQIPQTELEQKEFLSQLIDQGFFAVENSYKKRDRVLRELILHMGFFVHGSAGSTYPKQYTKRIIMESYTRGKLSDYCLGSLLMLRFGDKSAYDDNILTYLEELHPYPELVKKICTCIALYFTQKQ